MKRRYIYTDKEYYSMRARVASTYSRIAKRVAEDYNDEDIMMYNDLLYVLDILDGDIELKDDM